MQLKIETFNNVKGGNSFYKAVTHPAAAAAAETLLRHLGSAGRVALYDPLGFLAGFAEFYDLSRLALAGVFVQDVAAIGGETLGVAAQPVTDLPAARPDAVLVAAFDAGRFIDHIRHLVPPTAEIVSFDALRIPDSLLTLPANYLEPLNFATNFAFFRDADGLHTRLVTANYWSRYGAGEVSLALTLFDQAGGAIAEWRETVEGRHAAITLDSREIRERFDLPPFVGQLFIHVVGARGHDVVKYALDVFGDETPDRALSCTHDANSWPSDLYAGLPAPAEGEEIQLWVQNSHPCTIPAGAIGLNLMGHDEVSRLDRPIPPFASRPLDVAALLPQARWPEQIEMRAGKYCVRPRYEIRSAAGARRIAHVNVERGDLRPDPAIAELGNLLGKGFLLPAPILPLDRWRSLALPTPMATTQRNLPIAAIVYDGSGAEIVRHRFGKLGRAQSVAVAVDDLINGRGLASGWGHLEIVYDFAAGGEADGWLHGLFRYEDRAGGHAAETSFGAHVFNTVLTYKNEPQSYTGRPPGLSTRLFLRLGEAPFDTLCHLIYPASTPWHAVSATDLLLHDRSGAEIARRRIAIPCSGSSFWRYHETFDTAERRAAGDGAYLVVRDTTCRLFGYHGLLGAGGAFSLDHMFGF
ncbi:MAG: hypothetical protein JWL84_2346 [Rhodospirillales bacterium]|nr:hypothetical protein [Rhodospirillales bacterium]